jgi:hypothetical protein
MWLMNIIRGRRRDKLYQDWTKYAALPYEDIPQPEPTIKITGPRKLPPNFLLYVLLGAILLFLVVGVSLLIIMLLS